MRFLLKLGSCAPILQGSREGNRRSGITCDFIKVLNDRTTCDRSKIKFRVETMMILFKESGGVEKLDLRLK